MKAAVYHKPRDIRVEEVPEPWIEQPHDAILRVTKTAICGSDLHMYNGFIPQLRPMVLGHEFMGIVEEVGPAVSDLQPGDRVVVPFPIACGRCWFCKHGFPTQCERSNRDHYGPAGGLVNDKGGALFGYTDLYGGYPGGMAELVRVPYADYGPLKVPEGLTDEQVLFLTDILPTGWSAIEWAELQGGETVAVFGCGPVGLMAQKIAWLRGAGRVIAIDILPYRLEMAHRAANAEIIDASLVDRPEELVWEWTEGRGADVVVDAVGLEVDRSSSVLGRVADTLHGQAGTIKALKTAFKAVRRGGRVSIVGVYPTDYDNFPLGQIFDKGLTVRAGQALAQRYVGEILGEIEAGRLVADDIITHRLPLDETPYGFEIFNGKEDGCVKVVMTATP